MKIREASAYFENVLNIIISQSLNETSSQVNLIDDTGAPLETNVGMTIYDAESGALLFNYEHTMNAFGLPDTLYLDPIRKYTFVVHTLPKVVSENNPVVRMRTRTRNLFGLRDSRSPTEPRHFTFQ